MGEGATEEPTSGAPAGDRWSSARWPLLWAVALFGLQLAGPRTRHEGHDVFWVLGLLLLAGATWGRHRADPLAGLTAAGARLRAWWQRIKDEFPRLGVDLRCVPPLPRGAPPLFAIPALVGGALLALLLLRPFPGDVELVAAARAYAYAPYLIGLALLWAVYLGLGVLGPFLPFSALRDAYMQLRPARGDALRRPPRRPLLALGALMVALAVLVPSRVALCAVFAAVLVDLVLVWLPGQGSLTVVWRPNLDGARHRALDWRVLSSSEPVFIAVVVGLPLVVPDPWRPIATDWDVAPVTRALHWLACWGGAYTVLVAVALRAHHVLTASLRAPSRPVRPRIHVDSSAPDALDAVRGRLAAEGWNVAPRGGRLADDVALRVEPDAPRVSPREVPLSAPVRPDALDDAEFLWRLARRADLRSRRNVLHGLETIFRHAARASRDVGTGYIVAPHQWFFVGMERDIATPDDSEDVSMTGSLHPSFRAVMTRRARHHLWQVLSGVGVDLIHVEYGVGFRRVRVALRVLFEVYDVHGGRRQVQDRDFAGVHGVHAIVHDVDLEKPRSSGMYPEPDYELASRARILHLYRDRGGEEETVDVPSRSDGLPVLV
ncbi:MAG: hypothetical protein AAGB93_05605 [Planctomycetota bacterium]